MNDADIELRRRTYAFFIEHGRAPAAAELGQPQDVLAGWRRLHEVVRRRWLPAVGADNPPVRPVGGACTHRADAPRVGFVTCHKAALPELECR